MLDSLYEMKTSRRNSTLDSQRFRVEEASDIFTPIKKISKINLDKKAVVNPIEMESVHVTINKDDKKKGLFKFFKK
ncbi:MAG: hypothetical protein ACPKOI_10575 [Pleomorphochaeta sp.]|jgi:hypothetical protein